MTAAARKKYTRIPRADRAARAALAYKMIHEGKLNRDIRRETMLQFGSPINSTDLANLRKTDAAPQVDGVSVEANLRVLFVKAIKLMRQSRISFVSLESQTGQIRVERTSTETWTSPPRG